MIRLAKEVPHTASDFAPETAQDRGYAHQRRAARFTMEGDYAEAIVAYYASISAFEESSHPSSGKRVAFAEREIARLERYVAKGGAQ